MNSVTCQASALVQMPRRATRGPKLASVAPVRRGIHTTIASNTGTAQTASAEDQEPSISLLSGTVRPEARAAPVDSDIV